MLLVIAVMFTFSFGSAFAGVAGYDKTLATRNFELAMEAVKADGSVTVTVNTHSYVVKYATLEAHSAELLEAVLDYDKNGAASDYVDTAAEIKTVLDSAEYDVTMAVVDAQYAADKAEAIAILNGLDVSEYSTEDMPAADADGCKTYVAHVQYLINAAVKAINEATFNSDSTVENYESAKNTIDGYFDAYDDVAPLSTKLVAEKGYQAGAEYVGLGVYEINDTFLTGGAALSTYKAAYVEAQKATSAANVAAVKAQIASAYATYVATHTTSAEKTYAANLKEVLEFLADEKINLFVGPVTSLTWYFENCVAADVASAIANVDAFEAEAARLAAETDATGKLIRDAEDVADYVTEGTVNAYLVAIRQTGVAANYDTIASCKTAIENLYASLDDAKLAYAKKLRENFVAEFLEDAEYDYYPTELAKVKALTDEYLAKVNAVTSLAKVDDYDATYFGANIASYSTLGGSIALVPDTDDIDGLAAVTSLKNTAHSYVTLENTQITKNDNKYDVSGGYAKLDAEIESLVGNSSARTAKEIAALSEQAIALIKTLPTVGAVADAKEVADDAIDALPSGTVTTADKAVIDAAIAAVDAYEDMTEQNYSSVESTKATTLTTVISKYAYAYNNELSARVKAVDSADKAAVNALIDEIDAFIDDYGNATVFNTAKTTLNGYLTKIQKAAADKVTAAIVAIPVASNITEASKDKVEAARALYDAYVAEYTNYADYDYEYTATVTTDGFVADDFAYETLVKAETVLGVNTTDNAEENAKAYVQDLSIKARSVKTSKGVKITIKADVQQLLDDGFTVEYRFYRSTKSNANFGKPMIVKSTNTYTNTKGVKGTRYYYKAKLVVKNAAGEVVATTPLTQCLYATRVF